jgi:hypothetical protein
MTAFAKGRCLGPTLRLSEDRRGFVCPACEPAVVRQRLWEAVAGTVSARLGKPTSASGWRPSRSMSEKGPKGAQAAVLPKVFTNKNRVSRPERGANGWHRPPNSGRGDAPKKPPADLNAQRWLASPAPRDRNAPGKAALFFADFLLGGMKRKPGGVRGAAPAVIVLVSCLV